jgi:hypothetical protein
MPLLKRCFPDNLRDAAIENAHAKSSLSFAHFGMRLCINPQTGSMTLDDASHQHRVHHARQPQSTRVSLVRSLVSSSRLTHTLRSVKFEDCTSLTTANLGYDMTAKVVRSRLEPSRPGVRVCE